jgi:hypothetical protein
MKIRSSTNKFQFQFLKSLFFGLQFNDKYLVNSANIKSPSFDEFLGNHFIFLRPVFNTVQWFLKKIILTSQFKFKISSKKFLSKVVQRDSVSASSFAFVLLITASWILFQTLLFISSLTIFSLD